MLLRWGWGVGGLWVAQTKRASALVTYKHIIHTHTHTHTHTDTDTHTHTHVN